MKQFQYYKADIKYPQAIGFITLERFLQSQKQPKEEICRVLNQIACTEDKKTRSELKTQLYAFTPCVHVREKRKYTDIIKFTGLMVLDFDNIHNAVELKEHIFKEFKSIIAAWISPSGKGVKAIVRIPICNTVEEFKAYYWGIADDMFCFDGFDSTGQNAVLPLFISWDPDILIRRDATKWIRKGKNPKALTNVKPTSPPPVFDVTELHKKRVTGIIKSAISKAEGQGHPVVRSAALGLGGFVGYGYMSFSEALSLIYFLIETNSYLQKGVSGYKKTALYFLNEGVSRPSKLKD